MYQIIKYILVSLLAFSVLPGCFISPGNGHTLEKSSNAFQISGYSTESEKAVVVEAYNNCNSQWETVTTTPTSATASTLVTVTNGSTNTPVYRWEKWIKVPGKFWAKTNAGKYSVRLRAKHGYTLFKTFDQDWPSCWVEVGGDGYRFYQECGSDNSPEMEIFALVNDQEEIICCDRAKVEASAVNGQYAPKLRAQFDEVGGIDIGKPTGEFGVKHRGFVGRSSPHVQGVARLRDYNGYQRIAITDNRTKGLTIGYNYLGNSNADFSREVQINGLTKYGNYKHPGGIQAQGDLISVAMEDSNDSKIGFTSVYFLRSSGLHTQMANWMPLDGRFGETSEGTPAEAFAAGFIQLASGNFLVAISGKNSSLRSGIWFYESNQSIIDSNTTWRHIETFDTDSITSSLPNANKFLGAGGGINLVKDDFGKIYVFAMQGTSGTLGRERQMLQILEYSREDCGKVQLNLIVQQSAKLELTALRSFSFRWAGGVFVEKDGSVTVMNTERRTILSSNSRVNGKLFKRGSKKKNPVDTALSKSLEHEESTPAIYGVKKTTKNQAFTLYPNPVSTPYAYLKYESSHVGELQIKVTDLNGRVHSIQKERSSIGEQTYTIDISRLKSGLYLVELIDSEKGKQVLRLVVK